MKLEVKNARNKKEKTFPKLMEFVDQLKRSNQIKVASQLNGTFESIQVVDFIPIKRESGVFYVVGTAKLAIKPISCDRFIVASITFK